MTFSLGPANKILIIGGGTFVPDLIEIAHELELDVYVLTSKRHVDTDVLEAYESSGVRLHIADTLSTGVAFFEEDFATNSICLSLSNPWIVKDYELADFFGGKLLNCHGTRLPKDRGAGGFSWQILEGNRYGIVNLYLMTAKVDAGPIVDYEEFLYPMSCKVPRDYESFYKRRLLNFLRSRLPLMINDAWTPKLQIQPEYLSEYWPRLNSAVNGWIDWNLTADEIFRFICAFDEPYAGARTSWNGQVAVVKDCLINLSDGAFHPSQAGIVYRKNDSWLCVAARGGNLVLSSVCDQDGTSILGEICVGDRLWSSQESLSQALSRPRLGPEGWTEAQPV